MFFSFKHSFYFLSSFVGLGKFVFYLYTFRGLFFSSVEFTSFYSLLTLSFHSSVRIPYTRELYRRWAYFRPLFVDQVLVVFLYYYCCFNNLHQRVFHGHHPGRVKDFLLKWGDLFLEKQAAWTCGKKHGSTWWWLKVMTSSLNKEQWSR